MAGRYDHINFSPPQGVRSAMRVGLNLHKEGKTGPGLEAATVAMARRIAAGESISVEQARKGNRWWGRNERFLSENKDSPAYASAQLWGGRAGMAWYRKLGDQIEAADREGNALQANVVQKRGDEYCVIAESSGRNLGCYPTKEAADERLRQVEFFKREGNSMTQQIRVNWTTKVNQASIRKEKRNGKEVLIIPSATLPDNVVMNGGLYPAEEIEAGYRSLEGTPAPLGHPQVNGQFVPATNAEAINNFWVGAHNENVRRENGRVLLDKVVDIEVANRTEDGRRLLEAINQSKPIHTSTGLLLNREDVEGESFNWIARNMVFDHDAILLDEPGAATPDQGVGMMVNSDGDQITVVNVMYEDDQRNRLEFIAQQMIDMKEDEERNQRRSGMMSRFVDMLRDMLQSDQATGLQPKSNSQESDDMTPKDKKELLDAISSLKQPVVNADETAKAIGAAIAEANKPLVDAVNKLTAESQAKEAAQKQDLIDTVVNSNMVSKETAETLPITALQEMAANCKPGTADHVPSGKFQAQNSNDDYSTQMPSSKGGE